MNYYDYCHSHREFLFFARKIAISTAIKIIESQKFVGQGVERFESLESLEGFERLDGLERFEGVKDSKGLKGLKGIEGIEEFDGG